METLAPISSVLTFVFYPVSESKKLEEYTNALVKTKTGALDIAWWGEGKWHTCSIAFTCDKPTEIIEFALI